MSYENSLRRLSRAIPEESVPARLHSRVVDALPASSRPRNMAPLAAVSGMVALAVALQYVAHRGVQTLPADQPYHRNLSAPILLIPPVGRYKSWHFSGWRLRRGKKVSWEIWGRQSPFLYREQIGDEYVLDDGYRRVRLLPIEQGHYRPMVVVVPSQSPQATEYRDLDVRWLAGIESTACASYAKVGSFGPAAVVSIRHALDNSEFAPEYAMANGRYGIIFRSFFPYTDEKVITPNGPTVGQSMDGELSTTYDVAVPEEDTHIPIPSSAILIDATYSVKGKPAVNQASVVNSTVVHPEFIGIRPNGDVDIRIFSWLDEDPPLYSGFPVHLDVQTVPNRLHKNPTRPYLVTMPAYLPQTDGPTWSTDLLAGSEETESSSAGKILPIVIAKRPTNLHDDRYKTAIDVATTRAEFNLPLVPNDQEISLIPMTK